MIVPIEVNVAKFHEFFMTVKQQLFGIAAGELYGRSLWGFYAGDYYLCV